MSQTLTKPMKDTPSPIIVIGGGMVGIATAIWLQRAGQEVTLIDKAEPTERTSYGNAGVLASSLVLPVTMPGLVGKLTNFDLNPYRVSRFMGKKHAQSGVEQPREMEVS